MWIARQDDPPSRPRHLIIRMAITKFRFRHHATLESTGVHLHYLLPRNPARYSAAIPKARCVAASCRGRSCAYRFRKTSYSAVIAGAPRQDGALGPTGKSAWEKLTPREKEFYRCCVEAILCSGLVEPTKG